ncbi:uncharacterized protein LOC113055716 [Carassius auratus]|uniref:Uncharacterized protein LOC113055710 n=1 Tax=Carassius auratus TaxID=7957 RepID=A0A6P6L038_CARAU|nr:uncharacterized protein LOC113055710 [Carassius auratus]XP_026077890.1 uncharacterized protein LOC113055716 [Carassius auratus]
MTENRPLSYNGHDESDEESDLPTTKHFHHEEDESDEECDVLHGEKPKKGKQKITWKNKKGFTKKPSVQLASVNVDALEVVNVIDTYDRTASAYAEHKYARSGSYAEAFENKPGERIPKAGVYAEAGVARARAEYSVFEAEAKGPNASAGAGVSVVGAGAMARAEIASASAKAGPIGVKLGLGLDTGASVGLGGVEFKFLGTGVSLGPKTGVSVLGSEASCSVM